METLKGIATQTLAARLVMVVLVVSHALLFHMETVRILKQLLLLL
jgi:hypothetical protein